MKELKGSCNLAHSKGRGDLQIKALEKWMLPGDDSWRGQVSGKEDLSSGYFCGVSCQVYGRKGKKIGIGSTGL